MKKVLITGSTGYIGRALISRIHTNSHLAIHALYRDSKPTLKKISNVSYIEIGAFDGTSVEYDVVIHLAAYLTPERDMRSTMLLVDSNIMFGARLLSEIRIKKNGLLIDTGTCAELHGSVKGEKSNYLYAETKKAFQNIASYFALVDGYNYCKVFPYTVISKERESKKLIDMLLGSIKSKEKIEMTAGEQILDFIDRDDVISLYEKIVLSSDYSKLNKAEIECCTGVGTSIKDLASMVSRIANSELNIDWGRKPYRESDIMYAVGRPETAKKLVDWQAEFNLEATLKKIIC